MIMKTKKIKQRLILLSIALVLFLCNGTIMAQQSLWVGETYMCDATSSTMGSPTNISWSCSGGYISMSGSGLYRNVKITQYYSGTATVKCTWKYTLYYGGTQYTGSRTWNISCRENPVSIYPKSMTLGVGETGHVTYSHTYSNSYTSAANAYFSCSSNVISLSSDGTVKGLKPGTAYINVYSNISNNGNAPYCLVTVKEIAPTGVSLSDSEISLNEGTSRTLTATVYPSGASTTLTWSSDNTSVATVSSSGFVRAVGGGTTYIRVKTSNGYSASCKVKVTPLPTSVSLPPTLTVAIGSTKTLTPTLSPADATTTYTWSSEDNKIATVSSSGIVTGVGQGEVNIKVQTSNGKTATCRVTVIEPVNPTSVKLNKNFAQITKGYYLYLRPTLEPSDASTTYTWTSSDTSIATVTSSGSVRGIKEGEVTITVKTKNDKTNVCKVKVVSSTAKTEESKLNPKISPLKTLINKSLEQIDK